MRIINYDKAIKNLITFIKEKVGDAGATGVVIGVSGGVDSATVAHLATKALGKEKVLGLIMPYHMNQDVEDALLVCKKLGIEHKVINIKEIVNEFEKNIGFELDKVS